jgi:16S rRNA (guanine527-N7)-methyltransferase
MSTTELGGALQVGAAALGIDLTSQQADRLLEYLLLLQRWNKTYNLTSIRALDQMLVQHVFDCLSAVLPLRRESPPGGHRLLDVGSGGGLPGVVIAILNSGVEVTCVDSVGKKAAFVQQVSAELGLPNLRAAHTRVEALDDFGFQVVVSRAFASLAEFTSLTRGVIGTTGVWAAMKGQTPVAEIAKLPKDIDVFHVEQLSVPGVDLQRCIVWMRAKQSL